jgi:hypothetical protein
VFISTNTHLSKCTLIMADFTAQDLLNPNAVEAPTTYNGGIGRVQTSSSATFVNAANYIVLDAVTSSFSLRDTLAYRLNYAIGNPVIARVITHADLNDAVIVIQRTFELYCLIMYLNVSNAGIRWSFQACDIVPVNIWAAVPNRENALSAANALYSRFVSDNVFASRVCPNVQLAATLAVVNAIHREHMKGHTWITTNVGNRSSVTYKAIASAGEHRDALVAYAGPNFTGHDMFHIFDKECLDSIADALTNGTVIPGGSEIGDYNIGENDITLFDLFGLPQGCADRWPVGMAGKGAIYLGIAEIERVLSAITIVVHDLPTAGVIGAFNSLRTALADEDLVRADLLRIKDFVGTMSGFACGFSSANKVEAERIQGLVSLCKLVEKHPSQYATGRKLGEYFNDLELNKDTAVAIAREFIVSLGLMLGGILIAVAASDLDGKAELAEATAAVLAADISAIDMEVPEVERKATAKRRNANLDTLVKMNETQVTLADIDALDK